MKRLFEESKQKNFPSPLKGEGATVAEERGVRVRERGMFLTPVKDSTALSVLTVLAVFSKT